MDSEKIIEISNLSKSYGKLKAVDDVSFCVKKGELFAFLGINGAGKSTTISIMCGQLPKDGGTVIIDGVDLDKNSDKIKAELGVVFQNSALDKALNVQDNLKSRAALYGIYGAEFKTRLDELDKLLGLKEIYKQPVGKLSGGQRRRVDIARALLHKPKILILDEPTTGLDPQTRQTVWGVVNRLRREQGITVFLTTHYMEEAADADYVVILDSGKVVAHATPLELKNRFTGDFVTVYNTDKSALDALGIKYETVGDAARIALKDTAAATELIVAHPQIFKDYEVIKGKMDDVFLAATGKRLGGEEK